VKRVIIIQARMGSTRLPGKVLTDVAGKPMLVQQIRRIQTCQHVDEIVIATTTRPEDDPLVEVARNLDVRSFRGDEADVLGRYVGAARASGADAIVRITADCPLIMPMVIDQIMDDLTQHPSDCDYVSNVVQRTFPRGLDVEAFFWDVLLRLDRLCQTAIAREHVTYGLRSQWPELFRCRHIIDQHDNSDLRWTVDTPQDLELIRHIYRDLNLNERIGSYQDVLDYVRANPILSQLNAGIETYDPISR